MKRGITRWIARPGDAIEAAIERHILTPAESFAPQIVRSLRKCGGCKSGKRALNQESDTSKQV
jgi:hypothetical protein